MEVQVEIGTEDYCVISPTFLLLEIPGTHRVSLGLVTQVVFLLLCKFHSTKDW